MQSVIDLIHAKREHIKRLSNQKGAAGELQILAGNTQLISRPKGRGLITLLTSLRERGIHIKKTSFDVISLPLGRAVDFAQIDSVNASVADMTFIEIKTANQSRVRADFSGYFFAFTEAELMAAEALGDRHRVMLFNKLTGATLLTSVTEILARARSTTWQLSVQL